jgi:hypothetical protein
MWMSPWRVALFMPIRIALIANVCNRFGGTVVFMEKCCNSVASSERFSRLWCRYHRRAPYIADLAFAWAKKISTPFGRKKFYYNRLQLLVVLINMVLALKHRTASTSE